MSHCTVVLSRSAWHRGILAQHDDNDYSESGYVVFFAPDGRYYISAYGHCSCYDTWGSIVEGSAGDGDYFDSVEDRPVRAIWSGTRAELLFIADHSRDPVLVDRVASPEDHDYAHLMAVYAEVQKKLRPEDNELCQ